MQTWVREEKNSVRHHDAKLIVNIFHVDPSTQITQYYDNNMYIIDDSKHANVPDWIFYHVMDEKRAWWSLITSIMTAPSYLVPLLRWMHAKNRPGDQKIEPTLAFLSGPV